MERRFAELYVRVSPFLWSAVFLGLAAVACLHPSAAVSWSGVGLFALLALGAVVRGLAARRRGLEALRRGMPLTARAPALLGVYVCIPAWLAAMAYTAPCEASLRWTGAAFFGFVALAGAVAALLQPAELTAALLERLHDPMQLGWRPPSDPGREAS